MSNSSGQPKVVDSVEAKAFSVWLTRALKSCHDDVVHEPIPRELLSLLPPSPQQN